MLASGHDELASFLVGHPFDIAGHQRPARRDLPATTPRAASLNARTHTDLRDIDGSSAGRYLPAFFLSQRQRQCVFRTLTRCFNGGFIQTVDFQQFFHRHIGQLFQRGEAFFDRHCREIFINIKIFGEGIDSGMRFRPCSACKSSTVMTFSSQPLSCEARRTLTVTADSPARRLPLLPRYPWCLSSIHHDGRDVCRRHSVNHELRRVIITGRYRCVHHPAKSTRPARAPRIPTKRQPVDVLSLVFTAIWYQSRIASRRFDLQHFFTDFRHSDAKSSIEHSIGTVTNSWRARVRTDSDRRRQCGCRTKFSRGAYLHAGSRLQGRYPDPVRIVVVCFHHAGDDPPSCSRN